MPCEATEPLARPVFIDCDTGIDDALAIAYLIADPRVEIVGIGTVSGNVSAAGAAVNTLHLLADAGRPDIPVALGHMHPRVGQFQGGAPHVHGRDGMGDIDRRLPPGDLESGSAVALLEHLVGEHPGLSVLALGPLTNLADVVESRPHVVDAISRVVVMGGAFEHPGNVSPVAEANISNDPEAAALVFSAGWPVTIVPLDVTMGHALTAEHVTELASMRGAIPATLAQMLETYLDFYAGVYGTRQCALHDPLAAMILSGALCVTESVNSGVETLLTGADRGRTVLQSAPPSDEREIVLKVDREGAECLLSTLSAHSWPEE
ncbi:nucleoside hydrolase [Microbacterium sp. ANT_H45B]|nr:nucleoside hydrolase [Microbacterium sp. ANT_H45B]KQZ23234.1 hypothetical protein ASD43_01780 [Microbacterium sp. Root553]